MLSTQMSDTLMETLRMAGINLSSNAQVELGNKQGGEMNAAKYEECLEKFYSICDQMELHLKTASAHQYQSQASQRYTPSTVTTNPPPDIHKYTLYTSNVRQQVAFAKELHSLLVDATSSLAAPLPPPQRPQPQHHDSITTMDTQS
ncbi:mediator of RNA polymerase II transcription subunit 29 [Hyalella azteca]|uniref:Mediator of RNA polymerase II transcription subunit 29 n=1 Tax=Hyalella azteca TaxID=294128 RepID=A0A979FX33_HYAAZ|nr:mediator of RNA polymerase II transcription subunit 29 [Hyalella azteca]